MSNNVEAFNDLCDHIDTESRKVLNQAHQEYATNEDRFANFRMVAQFLKMHPKLVEFEIDELAEIVAWVYRLKHIISQIKGVSLREGMLGRTIDDINYGKLIAGLREERELKISLPDWEKPFPFYGYPVSSFLDK